MSNTRADWHKQAFYRISAYGVIRNEAGQILMVNEHDFFTLPGGGWDYGESLHEALVRELYEEIALVSDFREKTIAALPMYNENRQAWQMFLLNEIVYEELKFSIGEHATETKWFDIEDIDVSASSNKLIQAALQKMEEQVNG